jgi:hypothetical protein
MSGERYRLTWASSLIVRFIRTVTVKTCNQSWRKSSDRQNNGRSNYLMNRVCPNVRHENITLWSSSWRLKFIHSQFPLPMALNSIVSFIKMSDRDLKFVYLFCQTDTFLFVIETPIHVRKCKHPFGRNEHLQNVEH